MTSFEKRVERALAALGPLPQKMTFVYEDGRRVDVVGFLKAARQCSYGGTGIVDVPGATEGQKNFFLCSQSDISTLWDNETAGGKNDDQVNTQPDSAGRQTDLSMADARL